MDAVLSVALVVVRGAFFAIFRVYFPVSREFGAETGSHWTASSATQSRLCVELPYVRNVCDISVG